MTALVKVTDLQPLFWQLATYLVLTACLLIILGAAVAFLYTLVFEPIRGADADELDVDADRARQAQARLDAAYRTGTHVPGMHVVPRGVARVGPARHNGKRYLADRRNDK